MNCRAVAAGVAQADVIWSCAAADIAVTAKANTKRELGGREVLFMCDHNLVGQVRRGRDSLPGGHLSFASSEYVASRSLNEGVKAARAIRLE